MCFNFRKIIFNILKENVSNDMFKTISDERGGKGNYIDLRKNKYNIFYKDKTPDSLINFNDTAVNYWEETQDFFSFKKEKLNKNKKINTNQKYISKTFIDSLDDQKYNESDIILGYDEFGRLWILDGHHRLFYDRMNNKDSICYIISYEDIEQIDDIFYGNDD